MDLNLAGKTVVITGGGSNIGRAICHDFAKENVKMAIAELDETQGKKVEEEVKALGCEVIFVQTDITKNEQVEAMVKKVNDTFGTVDVLVNNVGWNVDDFFMKETREKWEKIVAINYWGPLNCTRAVLDQMIEKKKGAIVNIGSDAGRMGEFREVVYSGCKGGVIAFSKALAREMGKNGIRINVVCPGLTVPDDANAVGKDSLWAGDMLKIFTPEAIEKASKAYPLRKVGRAGEISKAVLFMASDCASHITGQTLSVSGGYTMM